MENSIIEKIRTSSKDIIKDNNFLFAAFENRLVIRLTHIFEKYKLPINKNIIKKNMEENLINNLTDANKEIIERYVKLLSNYEKIIFEYVKNNTKTEIIKKSTMGFIEKISSKNKTFITASCCANFLESIKLGNVYLIYDIILEYLIKIC